MGTRPRQVFGGAQYVHHRWLMEPWGCFVAEEGDGKIVGAAVAVMWGTLGLIGPVAVLPNYQNQDIGQQLVAACQGFFDENKAVMHGLVTYPHSPKHLTFYGKFGYRPRGLVAITFKALDRREIVQATRPVRPGLAVRRYSSLEEAKKKAAILKVRRITNALYRGMDVGKEIEIVDGLALGDTLLLEKGREVIGVAIYHTPGVSEAPAGSGYVKFLAIDPKQRKVEHLEQLVGSIEDLAQEQGLSRVILPVYLRYWQAYSTLVKCGYQVDQTMVRMQKGKQEDYEDPADLVLNDWRCT
jgi:N-acetylglutamate synthase-like GNAT family acetyltransferase